RRVPEHAAEFAVGVDLDASVALHLQHIDDCGVLDGHQRGVIDAAVQPIDASPAQSVGTYEATAMIGADDALCHVEKPCCDARRDFEGRQTLLAQPCRGNGDLG